MSSEATSKQILSASTPEIDQLKVQSSFTAANVIDVTPATPGINAILAKFDKEHTHGEDGVHFPANDCDLFYVHPVDGSVFAIRVETGELINVQGGTQRWFDLCDNVCICCLRLFEDMSGWTSNDVDTTPFMKMIPCCMGLAYLPPTINNESAVQA